MLREARKVISLYLVKRCSRIYEHFTYLLNDCLGIDSVFLCREHGVVGDMRDTWPNARVRKNHSLIHTYHGFKGIILPLFFNDHSLWYNPFPTQLFGIVRWQARSSWILQVDLEGTLPLLGPSNTGSACRLDSFQG